MHRTSVSDGLGSRLGGAWACVIAAGTWLGAGRRGAQKLTHRVLDRLRDGQSPRDAILDHVLQMSKRIVVAKGGEQHRVSLNCDGPHRIENSIGACVVGTL